MAVVAPVVEYYRLVDDGTSTSTYALYDAGSGVAPATLLDFGTVDAGTDYYEGTTANITASLDSCQVYAIFNAKGATSSTESSHMQNTVLSVVSNEAGHEGAKMDAVYDNAWIHCIINAETQADEIALGKDGTGEKTKTLTAAGLDQDPAKSDYGIIQGSANDGTLANSSKNYAIVKLWVSTKANAAAGPHYFRLRTTYSYT